VAALIGADAVADEVGLAAGLTLPDGAGAPHAATNISAADDRSAMSLTPEEYYESVVNPRTDDGPLSFDHHRPSPAPEVPVSSVRSSIALLGASLILLTLAAPAAARTSATLVVEALRLPSHAAADSAAGRRYRGLTECTDTAHRFEGGHQARTYRWSFKSSTTPAGMNTNATLAILKKSFSNITGANNNCGRPDNVSATHQYLGTTSIKPNCNRPDGHNVIGFGHLGFGILAVTCFWIRGGRITEADMKITTGERWALSMKGCRGDMVLLESTITHEAGHVFGLDHVGEMKHGRQTMSPYIDGPCENNETTLGLGDMLGLEQMY
jgi:hypothetical protein